MKRTTAFLTCLAALLSLAACGSRAASRPADAPAASPAYYAVEQAPTRSPAWIRALPEAKDPSVTQLFVVAGMGMDKTTATVSLHERGADGRWEQVFSTPGYVGRNGLCADGDHAEGCGQTPIGTYGFNAAFGIPYTKVTDDIWWSGDEREGMHYNEMVDVGDLPGLDLENSEHIVDYDYEYQYCLNISFNDDGTAGRGSAIFLHCLGTQKPYTGGCVAIPEYIMKQFMQRVQPDCVVVIDTLENMSGAALIGKAPVPFIDDRGSALYTKADMDAAVALILAQFGEWDGFELHSVIYAGDACCSGENLSRMNEPGRGEDYTQCISFLSDFRSPADAGGDWKPDTEYTDWQWWLARTAGGDWELLSRGS